MKRALLLILGCVLVWSLSTVLLPRFGEATYRFEGQEEQIGALPLFPKAESEFMEIRIPVEIPLLLPTTFLIKPDDCLEELSVNDEVVDDPLIPYCDYGNGKPIDLTRWLKRGTNILQATVRDHGGDAGINVTVLRTSLLPLTGSVILIALVCWYICSLSKAWKGKRRRMALATVLMVGVALRILYAASTPYYVRGHDTDAHIDYIEYMTEHGRIPPAIEGWEYHQPPLYYAASALVWSAGKQIDLSEGQILTVLSGISLLLSLLTLALGIWIGAMLWPEEKSSNILAVYGSMIAALPSLIFLGSRIGNDVLAQPLSFLALAFLVRFWLRGNLRFWYLSVAVIALGFLAKASAVLLMPPIFLAMLLLPKRPLRERFLHVLVGTLMIVCLTGWLPVQRLIIEKDTTKSLTFGNLGMHGGLKIPTGIRNFTTFIPSEILRQPSNNPWEDKYRRTYFWEYFFRAAFFGEFGFESLSFIARYVLFFAMLLLPLGAYGLIAMGQENLLRLSPVIASGGMLLFGSLAYRVAFPYAPNQYFRFSVLLIVPIATLIASSVAELPKDIKHLGYGMVWGAVAAC